jgi:hypothetical protein
LEDAIFARVGRASEQVEGACGNGQQRLPLNEREKIAVLPGVHLQAVTAVFDDIGIDKPGHDALAPEAFAHPQRKLGSAVGPEAFGLGRRGHLATHSSSSETARMLF